MDLRRVAVRLGDQLEQMAVGILEIDAAAAPVMVDLAGTALVMIGEVVDARLLDARERGIELLVVDQEGIVLGAHILGIDEAEADAVAGLHAPKRSPLRLQ